MGHLTEPVITVTDSRPIHYTATVEIHQVRESGLVKLDSYDKVGRELPREVVSVSRLVIRADDPEKLQDKLLNLIDTGAFQ